MKKNKVVRKRHIRRTTNKVTTVRQHTMKKPCPGSKIRSGGKGRGLGTGKGKGPINKSPGLMAYCVKCRQLRPMQNPKIVVKKGRRFAVGTCPVCGTTMYRTVSKDFVL